MTRLHLILACALAIALATRAEAQSYQYSTPQGAAAANPMSPDAQMFTGTYPPAAQYHAAIPAPPAVKLPPGVKADNGLLYYNGAPYQDPSQGMGPGNPNLYGYNPYQNNPYQNYPVQTAAYQQAMQGGGMAGGMNPSVMSGGPGPMQGPGMGMQGYGGMQGAGGMQMQGNGGMQGAGDVSMQGYGGMQGGCPDGSCNGEGGAYCGDCQDGAWWHHHCCLFAGMGKLGYYWTGSVDALEMQRNTGISRALVLNSSTLATEFNTTQWDITTEAGVRAALGLTTPSGMQYQGVFMAINRMGDSRLISDPNNLQIPFPLAADTVDFFGADQMVVRYDSNAESAEANAIIPWGSFQFLAGYRYFQLRENSDIEAFDFFDGDVSDYNVGCTNNLNGGQIGILGQWEACGHLDFDFFAKTGVFCNSITEHQTLGDFGNTVLLRDASGNKTDVAFISELAAQVTVPLGARFSIQGGYRVFFLNRMALAPGQFDFTDVADSGTHVNNTSNIVLHGANLGFTARW